MLFAESVSNSKDLILIRELAKLIKQNGVDIGEKRLYTWLRKENYLIIRKGSDYNSPTQKSMDLGLFVVLEGVIRFYYDHKNNKSNRKRTGIFY